MAKQTVAASTTTSTSVKPSLKAKVGKAQNGATVPARAQSSEPAPTPAVDKPKAPPAEPKEKAPKPVTISINKGARTGMRVMKYQDYTFFINDRADRRFTNEELAADWRAEFPDSRAVRAGRITAEMVGAVRHLYNAGKGDHGPRPEGAPESHPYVVVDGKRVKAPQTRPAPVKAAAAKAVAKEGAPKTPQTTKTVKAAKKSAAA